ncbi:MAG: D-glycerate dehydrogenase [Robiginitomaculum sp.]|nr:MAG: D-glycerate dehydrogenase [Robiginitomaculum sp.]
MTKRTKVIVTRRLPEPVQDRLNTLFEAQLNLTDTPFSHDELKTAAANCEVLSPTVTDTIDAAVIEAGAGRLKIITNYGAGVDHIDLEAAVKAGITVTNTPGVLTEDTADLAMALILAVPRRLAEGARVMRAGGFAGWAPTWMMGHSIGGKKLGIVGMGRIGQALARRAKAFGLEVHYHNRNRVSAAIEKDLGALWWEDLDAMLAQMDIISINCPKTPQTYHLLSRERLMKLPAHAFLVNTSRGDVLDETALADLLEAGRLAGAGLDVYEHEPKVDPRLLKLDCVVALPHMGSSTIEARIAMGEKMIINIKAFEDGHRPPDRVIVELT